MGPQTESQRRAMYMGACMLLIPLGWVSVGWMLFHKDGKTYDLSAADLSQIERIEREGLFRVEEPSRNLGAETLWDWTRPEERAEASV